MKNPTIKDYAEWHARDVAEIITLRTERDEALKKAAWHERAGDIDQQNALKWSKRVLALEGALQNLVDLCVTTRLKDHHSVNLARSLLSPTPESEQLESRGIPIRCWCHGTTLDKCPTAAPILKRMRERGGEE